MALPVTITGISTAVAPVGPFKSSGLGPLSISPPNLGSGVNFGTTSNSRAGQTFTASASGGTVTSFTIRARKFGSPVDNVTVAIFATSGGAPIGSALVTGTLSGSTLTTSFAPYTVAVSSTTLTANTVYAVVFGRSGSASDVDYYQVNYGADVYSGGNLILESASVWDVVNFADSDCIVTISNAEDQNCYFFGRDGTTATTLQAFKAGSPDTSWASAATKTGFTTAILNIAGYQIGNVVHLLVQDGTMSSSVATKYVSYDMATDTFLATTETVSAAAILTGSATSGWGCSLVVRSNGEVVAFYNGVQTKVSTQWSRVYYRRRTAVNTYGTETLVDAGLGVNNTAPIVVLGATDRVHFCFFNATNTLQRHLTSANVLGTVASTGAIAATLDICSFNDAGTIRHVGFTPAQTIRWASADNPTVTAASVTFGTPTRTADDGTDVYGLYQNSADSDLYTKKSTDRGATFATGIDVFTATVAAVDANVSKNQLMYQRGSNVVFPYVANDNGTLKYNEAVVRSIVTTKALPLFSTPRQFAMRHF